MCAKLAGSLRSLRRVVGDRDQPWVIRIARHLVHGEKCFKIEVNPCPLPSSLAMNLVTKVLGVCL